MRRTACFKIIVIGVQKKTKSLIIYCLWDGVYQERWNHRELVIVVHEIICMSRYVMMARDFSIK